MKQGQQVWYVFRGFMLPRVISARFVRKSKNASREMLIETARGFRWVFTSNVFLTEQEALAVSN